MLNYFRPLLRKIRSIANWWCLSVKYANQKLVIGQNCHIKHSVFSYSNIIYDRVFMRKCTLGRFTYISNDVSMNLVNLGSFCSIGPGCRIGLGKHPASQFVSTHPAFYSVNRQAGITFTMAQHYNEYEQTIIGNDVWIGANVIVHDGVKIGNGAIIAAGAIVRSDVPCYAIVAGSPSQIIGYRFTEEEIDYLINLEWWNKDINWLTTHVDDMKSIKNIMQLK